MVRYIRIHDILFVGFVLNSLFFKSDTCNKINDCCTDPRSRDPYLWSPRTIRIKLINQRHIYFAMVVFLYFRVPSPSHARTSLGKSLPREGINAMLPPTPRTSVGKPGNAAATAAGAVGGSENKSSTGADTPTSRTPSKSTSSSSITNRRQTMLPPSLPRSESLSSVVSSSSNSSAVSQQQQQQQSSGSSASAEPSFAMPSRPSTTPLKRVSSQRASLDRQSPLPSPSSNAHSKDAAGAESKSALTSSNLSRTPSTSFHTATRRHSLTPALKLDADRDSSAGGLGAAGAAGGADATRPGDSSAAGAGSSSSSSSGAASVDDRIKVVVRMRPRNQSDKRGASAQNKHVIVVDPDSDSRAAQNVFMFDRVFDESASQTQLFEEVGRNAVDQVLQGFNSTIFAYGQTSSGKTFTIRGAGDVGSEQGGMIPQCAAHLFRSCCAARTVTVGYFEVYCETVYDLLAASDGTKLNVRKKPSGTGFYAEGQTHVEVASLAELLETVARGDARRRVAATMQNERSSRSHAVLTLTVKKKMDPLPGADADAAPSFLYSKLNLVDLAGSEKYNVNKGAESVNINLSLSTLSIVIQRLSLGHAFVNFRDSELTKLLEDSLSGMTKTTLIACVNADAANRSETLNTLRFAFQAKSIPIDAKQWQQEQARTRREKLESQIRDYVKLQERFEAVKKLQKDHLEPQLDRVLMQVEQSSFFSKVTSSFGSSAASASSTNAALASSSTATAFTTTSITASKAADNAAEAPVADLVLSVQPAAAPADTLPSSISPSAAASYSSSSSTPSSLESSAPLSEEDVPVLCEADASAEMDKENSLTSPMGFTLGKDKLAPRSLLKSSSLLLSPTSVVPNAGNIVVARAALSTICTPLQQSALDASSAGDATHALALPTATGAAGLAGSTVKRSLAGAFMAATKSTPYHAGSDAAAGTGAGANGGKEAAAAALQGRGGAGGLAEMFGSPIRAISSPLQSRRMGGPDSGAPFMSPTKAVESFAREMGSPHDAEYFSKMSKMVRYCEAMVKFVEQTCPGTPLRTPGGGARPPANLSLASSGKRLFSPAKQQASRSMTVLSSPMSSSASAAATTAMGPPAFLMRAYSTVGSGNGSGSGSGECAVLASSSNSPASAELVAERDDLRAQLAALRAETDAMKQAHEAAAFASAASLAALKLEMQSAVSAAVAAGAVELDALKQDLAFTRAENASIRAAAREAASKYEEQAEDRREACEVEAEAYQLEIAQLKKDLEDVHAQAAATETELKNKIEVCESSLTTATTLHIQQVQELESKLNKTVQRIVSLQVDVDDAQTALATSAQRVQALEAEAADAAAEHADLKRSLAAIQTVVVTLTKEKSELQDALEASTSRIQELEEKLEEANASITSAETELEALRVTLSVDKEEAFDVAAKLKSQVTMMQQQAADDATKHEELVQAHEAVCADATSLREQLADAKAEISHMESRVQRLEASLAKTEASLDAAESAMQVVEARAQRTSLLVEAQTSRAVKAEDRAASVEQQLSLSTAEIAALKSEVHTCNARIEVLQQSLAAADALAKNAQDNFVAKTVETSNLSAKKVALEADCDSLRSQLMQMETKYKKAQSAETEASPRCRRLEEITCLRDTEAAATKSELGRTATRLACVEAELIEARAVQTATLARLQSSASKLDEDAARTEAVVELANSRALAAETARRSVEAELALVTEAHSKQVAALKAQLEQLTTDHARAVQRAADAEVEVQKEASACVNALRAKSQVESHNSELRMNLGETTSTIDRLLASLKQAEADRAKAIDAQLTAVEQANAHARECEILQALADERKCEAEDAREAAAAQIAAMEAGQSAAAEELLHQRMINEKLNRKLLKAWENEDIDSDESDDSEDDGDDDNDEVRAERDAFGTDVHGDTIIVEEEEADGAASAASVSSSSSTSSSSFDATNKAARRRSSMMSGKRHSIARSEDSVALDTGATTNLTVNVADKAESKTVAPHDAAATARRVSTGTVQHPPRSRTGFMGFLSKLASRNRKPASPASAAAARRDAVFASEVRTRREREMASAARRLSAPLASPRSRLEGVPLGAREMAYAALSPVSIPAVSDALGPLVGNARTRGHLKFGFHPFNIHDSSRHINESSMLAGANTGAQLMGGSAGDLIAGQTHTATSTSGASPTGRRRASASASFLSASSFAVRRPSSRRVSSSSEASSEESFDAAVRVTSERRTQAVAGGAGEVENVSGALSSRAREDEETYNAYVSMQRARILRASGVQAQRDSARVNHAVRSAAQLSAADAVRAVLNAVQEDAAEGAANNGSPTSATSQSVSGGRQRSSNVAGAGAGAGLAGSAGKSAVPPTGRVSHDASCSIM